MILKCIKNNKENDKECCTVNLKKKFTCTFNNKKYCVIEQRNMSLVHNSCLSENITRT